MLANTKQNILQTYKVRSLTTVYFENYSISRITLNSIERKNYFGTVIEGRFFEKLEGKIVIKAWIELPSLFTSCKLGQYGLKENEFSGIITIDNRLSQENSKKLTPIIIGYFKSRSTKLLNQFHGTHGRIFWENNFSEYKIENLNDLNRALTSIRNI